MTKRLSPFDWIKSINEKTEIDMSQIDEYVPYIVNRGLAHFEDCVLWTNEANKLHQLDKELQYAFLFGVVNKRRRFSKWVKKETDVELQPIMEYYKVSEPRAMEISKLINTTQMEQIKERLSRGGR
jgi:hypothetical protein